MSSKLDWTSEKLAASWVEGKKEIKSKSATSNKLFDYKAFKYPSGEKNSISSLILCVFFPNIYLFSFLLRLFALFHSLSSPLFFSFFLSLFSSLHTFKCNGHDFEINKLHFYYYLSSMASMASIANCIEAHAPMQKRICVLCVFANPLCFLI